MAVESIGALYPTKIPGYADAADIQAALRAYHYGSYTYDTANTSTGSLVANSMAKFLFDVQQENRLKQSGLLKRFSINCYGHQETVEEMRAEKSEKHKELKGKRDDPEFEEWFLRYRPSDKMNVENKPIQKKDKKRNTDNKDKTYKKTYSVKRPSSNSKTSSNNKTKKNKMMKRIFGKKFTKGIKGIKGKERGRGALFV